MDIYRFIIRGYPASTHPQFHEWQKATLVLLISASDPYSAEQKSLLELEKRKWAPESYELKDILIEERVREEGGVVLNAYVEAGNRGVYWHERLDDLAMTQKGSEVWGTGPKLNEDFIDSLIIDSGGHRVTREEAGNFKEKNADYVLGTYILELKQFEQEGLEVSTRQEKISQIFDSNLSSGPAQQIDPYQLNESDFQEYWNVVGIPVQKRIKAASKQVKSTIKRLGEENYTGGVILLNTGYLTIPHELLVSMAERYAKKDTSSISDVIVISSWTMTNGFDTVVNYGFHPHEPSSLDIVKLRDTFWSTINRMMTQMITGELDVSSGMQEPMSPTHFKIDDETFTFGVPQLESSLRKKKKRPNNTN
ncbi:hypothetical protein [Desulfoluna spongiiphila]|uniref:Uncharacterized protein n=1 Tax=Desulfoluna spongiiphila TaxID=419481 RepID=A0A1G5INL8_9BACT|nr:hypothetical protein [Desulfoluna spongiiphila]SCY77577.1 hypothetical protein SAMN05216233_1213 [Desulfoluna spongiiphila]